MDTRLVALDGAGNLVLANSGVSTPFPLPALLEVVAARTGTFYGQKMAARHIYTVAGNGKLGFSGDGGPATRAEFVAAGVAIDRAGNVFIGDAGRVRKVPG